MFTRLERTKGELCLAIALSMAGASILALAMDHAALGWLCWLAAAPLLHYQRGADARRAVGLTAIFTATFYGVLLRDFGEVGPGPYLFVVVGTTLIYSTAGFIAWRWLRPAGGAVLGVAGLWVLTEMFKSRLGLEWGTLGYTQWSQAAMLGLAGVIGAQGISFLIWMTNAHLALEIGARGQSGARGQGGPPSPGLRTRRLALAGLALGLLVFTPRPPSGTTEPGQQARTVDVTLVPGHVAAKVRQMSRSRPAVKEKLLATYLAASAPQADVTQSESHHSPPRPRVVVWPETAVDLYADRDYWLRKAFSESSLTPDTTVLLGALGYSGALEHPYNSAYAIDHTGEVEARYDKSKLVPWFEYQPLPELWGFLKVANRTTGFSPGVRDEVFDLAAGKFGLAICYEENFADGFRRQVRDGAEVLVTLGSASFARSFQLAWHMHVFARFRAAENRRFLVRSVNGGISEVIDPHGRIVASLPYPGDELQDGTRPPATIRAAVERRDELSAFVKWGYPAMPAVSLLALLGALGRRRVAGKVSTTAVSTRVTLNPRSSKPEKRRKHVEVHAQYRHPVHPRPAPAGSPAGG